MKYFSWTHLLPIIAAFAFLFVTTTARAESPAMWRLSDSDSEIWLFGTVHLLPPEVRWRTTRFDTVFAAADTVILELDLNPSHAGRIRTLTLQLGQNANFMTLSSILGPNDSNRLAKAAAKLGIAPEGLEPLRPWLASVQLSLMHMAQQGYDPTSGVDSVIASMANAAGKRLAYFETIEDQFKVFARLSEEAEKAFLMAAIKQIESESGAINQLVHAWAAGNTNGFNKLFKEMRGSELPDLHEALFVRRNRLWVEQIAHVMKGSGKALVAVGAGHLPGQQGVVALLRAKGFEVKRL